MNLSNHWKKSGIQSLLLLAIGVTLLSLTFQQIAENKGRKNRELMVQTFNVLNQNNLNILILEAETHRINYLLTGELNFFNSANQAVSDITETFSRLSQLTADNEEQKERLKDIQDLVNKKFAGYPHKEQNNDTLDAKQIISIIASVKGKDDSLIKSKVEEFLNYQSLLQKEQDANLRESGLLSAILLWLSGIFTVIILLIGIRTINRQIRLRKEMFNTLDLQNKDLLFNDGQCAKETDEQLVVQNLIANLKNATSFINEVGRRKYEVPYEGINESNNHLNKENLAGSLIDMRDQMKNVADEEKSRNWSTEGLALFSDILRKENEDVNELCFSIISSLVKYLKVNQGGIFLLNEESKEDRFLELKACFAYERKKYMQKRVNIGQGLLGQAYLERDYIYLTNIPESYMNITSGLGNANPRSILIVPLISNDTVLGVMELASFQHLKPVEIEFVKKLAESIASTVLSVRINENTKKLLQASQEQAEEMRAQEEEMRQNLEELQATQEEINRKNIDIQNRMEAIENSGIASVEFDMNGTITNANRAFLSLFEYQLEEIVGKKHHLFMESDAAGSDEYKNLWNGLERGIASHGDYKRITKSGREVYIQGAYSVIMGKNGRPEKVLNLSSDITGTKSLLIEVQEQTEELRAQEEEMRQNMEELQATQEELTKQMVEIQCRMEGINNSGIASLELDMDGNILAANTAFVELLGYSLEEIEGKAHKMLVSEELALSTEYQTIWQNLKEGKGQTGEFEYISKSGDDVYVMGSYFVILDQHDKPQKVINLAIDITESKNLLADIQEKADQLKAQEEFVKENFADMQNTQAELMKQNRSLQSRIEAINNSNLFSLEFDLEGKVTSANKTFLETMGYDTEEIKGVSYHSLLHPKVASSEDFKELFEQLKKGKICSGDFQYITKTGKEIRLKGSYSTVLGPEGQPECFIKLAEDLTGVEVLK